VRPSTHRSASRVRRLVAPALAGRLALASSACVTQQGTVMVATTRDLDLDLRGRDLTQLPVKRDVVGSDTRVTAIVFIPTMDQPRLERAVEEALLAGGGDIMTRVRVTSTDFWFLLGFSTIRVQGDVIDLAEGEIR
jgi:hypothetical protein